MNGRLILCAAVAAATALASGAPALAYEPANQTNEMEGYSSHPTLTAEEAAAQAKKLAAFDEFVASRGDSGRDGAAPAAVAHTLPTYERQQFYSYFCGPAAIQDVADYAWNKGEDGRKFTQREISDNWTHTTTSGTTVAPEVIGANGAIDGSPHDNGVYNYAAYEPTSGSDWWWHLQFDIDDWEMPQIVNLTPWWWNGSGGYWVWLHDWSGHQSTTGHYIVGNGYRGGWDTSADDDFRFDDGAEGFGGGTGTWWDSPYDVWRLIHNHNNIVIW